MLTAILRDVRAAAPLSLTRREGGEELMTLMSVPQDLRVITENYYKNSKSRNKDVFDRKKPNPLSYL